MRKFQVFWGSVYVGNLFIDEQGQYKYTLNDGVKEEFKLNRINVAPAVLVEKPEFGDPIPYFMVRIEANERFKDLDLEIGFVTDEVRIREII